jgi:hypothetical protein
MIGNIKTRYLFLKRIAVVWVQQISGCQSLVGGRSAGEEWMWLLKGNAVAPLGDEHVLLYLSNLIKNALFLM